MMVFASTVFLLWLKSANAQLVEAECGTWPPGTPFPDALYLEDARRLGIDTAWRTVAAKDAVRAGKPPAPPSASSTPAWIWHADRAAVARSRDLGIFVSRFSNHPQLWERGVSDGYIVSAWAFVTKGTPKLIASIWLHEKNDRPVNPQCENSIRIIPVDPWSPKPRGLDLSDVGPAAPPPEALRDADNELIAKSTCRDRWPPIIAASGEDHGTFLLPRVGEVLGGASLRPLLNVLPDEPVRWRRLKLLASRDGKLGLSIGGIVNCDTPEATQTYIGVWVRDGESWRLELLAITP